jgi:hypothetical protein
MWLIHFNAWSLGFCTTRDRRAIAVRQNDDRPFYNFWVKNPFARAIEAIGAD